VIEAVLRLTNAVAIYEFKASGLSIPEIATFFRIAFWRRYLRKKNTHTATTNATTPPLNPAIKPIVPAEREDDTVD